MSPAVVQTHVSVLLFTDDLVLKFKKPVRLPFVDFTTREARRRACEEEVEANRRLSPDVYLGVADVQLEGRPTGAEPVEHAVVMRRLPAQRSLAALVRAGDPAVAGGLERVAAVMAGFHARAQRSPAIDDDARASVLRATWRRCLDTLSPFAGRLVDAETLEEVDRLAMAYLAGRGPLLEQRIADGRVCDGHGDLLADDVFLLDDGPRVLDCLEFDPQLRHVDVVADVAFLAMDLERLGAPELARRFLDAYQEVTGDLFPPTLLEHYLAERATVRAEVTCLQGGPAATASALLAMARDHLRRGRVRLLVVSGLPGTGKSTLAVALGDRLGWPVLRSDEIRRELVAPGRPGPLVAEDVPGAYDDAVTERTYATMLERARVSVGVGQPVILDATFSDRRRRKAVETLACDAVAELAVVTCRAPAAVAASRMQTRRAEGSDLSGADEEVARAVAERGGAAPWAGAVEVDTSGSGDEVVDLVEKALDLP
jgi:uncharacterized protein